MKYYQPIINSGTFASELPQTFPSPFFVFKSEQDCFDWIAKNKDNFTLSERSGGVYAQEFDEWDIEGATIIDSDGIPINKEDVEPNYALALTKEECLESLIGYLNTPIIRRHMSKDMVDCLDRYLSL